MSQLRNFVLFTLFLSFFLWTAPVNGAVITGPSLTQVEKGWADVGLMIRAEANVTLVSVRFPNQGLADTIKLRRMSDSALLASIPVEAGNRDAIVEINYPLVADELYSLVATTPNNKYYGNLGIFSFPVTNSEITVVGSYIGMPYYSYWFTFNDITTDPIVMESVMELNVAIDIKPDTDINSINLKSRGVVPVAVITTEEFDAAEINPESVLFAGAPPVRWHFKDVDGDGDNDLLFHFKTEELTDLSQSSAEAVLTGLLFEGTPFSGTDAVNIVPGK
jgi:hypothetical protein